MDCAHQATLSMEFPRQKYWSGLPFPSPEYLISSVQSLSHVRLFVTPWTTACKASLSITNSWGLLKLMSIELVMPSKHLILCCPLSLINEKKKFVSLAMSVTSTDHFPSPHASPLCKAADLASISKAFFGRSGLV